MLLLSFVHVLLLPWNFQQVENLDLFLSVLTSNLSVSLADFFRIISLTESFQPTHPTKIHLQSSSLHTSISHLDTLSSAGLLCKDPPNLLLKDHFLNLLFGPSAALLASPPWLLLLRCKSKLLGFSFKAVIYSIPITSYFSAERSTPAYAQAWDQLILNRLLWAFSLLGRVPIHKNKPGIWNCL